MSAGPYCKVAKAMWGDSRFRSLSRETKLLWNYLLTGPITTTLPGLIQAGRLVLAEELDYEPSEVDACLAELEARGMLHLDRVARLIWLPNAMKYNAPANPNIAVSWRKEWSVLPDCDMKLEAYDAIVAFLWTLDSANPQDFVEAFRTGKKPKAGAPLNGLHNGSANKDESVSETVTETNSYNNNDNDKHNPNSNSITKGVQGEKVLSHLKKRGVNIGMEPTAHDLRGIDDAVAEGVTPEDIATAIADGMDLERNHPIPWGIKAARARHAEASAAASSWKAKPPHHSGQSVASQRPMRK